MTVQNSEEPGTKTLLPMYWSGVFLVIVASAFFLPPPAMARELEVVLVAEGFGVPSNFVTPGGGDPRILVLERETGKVRTILDGKVLFEPFLDIGDRVYADDTEDGLVGIAFPPDFRDSRHVYLAYTPNDKSMVLSRFNLSDDLQSADQMRLNTDHVVRTGAKGGDGLLKL